MRSFFLFIIRNCAVFLFLLLEFISLYFVFTYNDFHKTYFINSANQVTGNVLNTYGNFEAYFDLKQVNDSLVNENARLRKSLKESLDLDTAHMFTVSDSTGRQLFTYIPAMVIGNSFTEPNNYITLDKGSDDGIRVDMGVITSNGIVGIVVKVSPHFSVVMSVLHSEFTSNVAIRKNNAQGRLRWDGKYAGTANVVDVAEPGTLQKGDTIVTSTNSKIFPANQMVGTIESYGKNPGSNYYNLQIHLSTGFSSLKYVYVVNINRKSERDAIENEVNNANH